MRIIRMGWTLLTLGALTGAAGATGGVGAPDDVVARVGQTTITLGEVDARSLEAGVDPYQALYDARRRALREMIDDLLLEREATRRQISVDELLEQEVRAKLTPVSDEQVQAFFDENRARMGNRSIEDVREPIREFLAANQARTARAAFVDLLRGAAGVELSLEPPRVELKLAANEPVRGPSTAPVTVVEYSDFQ